MDGMKVYVGIPCEKCDGKGIYFERTAAVACDMCEQTGLRKEWLPIERFVEIVSNLQREAAREEEMLKDEEARQQRLGELKQEYFRLHQQAAHISEAEDIQREAIRLEHLRQQIQAAKKAGSG